MPDEIELLTSALSGSYAVERELGRGGMATVYLATDLKHDRQVAIKVLRAELAAAVGHDRFLREIKTTAQLSHPHIVPLLDSGAAGDQLFYVMPLVEYARRAATDDVPIPRSVDPGGGATSMMRCASCV